MKKEAVSRLSFLKRDKANQTRKNILEAASWLAKHKGFSKTPLNEVVSKAGMNKAIIFLLFPRQRSFAL